MKTEKVKRLSFILFMSGFLAGVMYVNLFARDYILSLGIFSDYFLEQFSGTEIHTEEYLFYIIKLRVFPLLCLSILISTRYRRAVGIIFILWTGFSIGLILTTAIIKLNLIGIVLCVIGILPHFICYISVYIILLIYGLTYPEVRWNSSKTISIIIFMLSALVGLCYYCVVATAGTGVSEDKNAVIAFVIAFAAILCTYIYIR